MPFFSSRYPFAFGKTTKPACSASATENGWLEPEAGVEAEVLVWVGVWAGVEAEAWPEVEAVGLAKPTNEEPVVLGPLQLIVICDCGIAKRGLLAPVLAPVPPFPVPVFAGNISGIFPPSFR